MGFEVPCGLWYCLHNFWDLLIVLISFCRKYHVLKQFWQECQSRYACDSGGVGWCYGNYSSCRINLGFLRSYIGDSLARAKTVWVVSVFPEIASRSISNIDTWKSKKMCSHQKDGVPTVQLMILTLVLPVHKYIFNIRTDGVPIVNWWYSILPYLLVNSSLVCLLESYECFTSNKKMLGICECSYGTYLYFWYLWTFLRHLPSFIDGYKLLTLNLFLYWWVQMFHVTYLHLLTVFYVSRYNPFFLENYECFLLKPFFLGGYECFS